MDRRPAGVGGLVVVTAGLIASGKSTVGERIAQELAAPRVVADAVRFLEVVDGAGPGAPEAATAAASTGRRAVIASFSAGGEQTILEWNTDPGKVYTVYWSTNLVSGDWTPLYTTEGDGLPRSFTNADAEYRTGFYRVGVE